MKKKETPIEIFLGKPIYETNRVELSFDKEDYKQLVAQSYSLGGISIPSLLKIQRLPCQNCGCDNVLIKKLPLQISRVFRRIPKIQLYVFIENVSDDKYIKCDLAIDYSLLCIIGAKKGTLVYTIPSELFSYKGGDSENVLVILMKNQVPHICIMCDIKNGILTNK